MLHMSHLVRVGGNWVASCAASSRNRSVRPEMVESLCPFTLRPPPSKYPTPMGLTSEPTPVRKPAPARADPAPVRPEPVAEHLRCSPGPHSLCPSLPPVGRKPAADRADAASVRPGLIALTPHPFALSLSKGLTPTALHPVRLIAPVRLVRSVSPPRRWPLPNAPEPFNGSNGSPRDAHTSPQIRSSR